MKYQSNIGDGDQGRKFKLGSDTDAFYKREETGEIICEECLLESDMVTTFIKTIIK